MNFVSILWLVFVISRATTDRVIKPLPNVVAIVGKPFVHLLSKINGADIQYKVFEEDKASLPKWLSYDSTTNTVQGIPTSRDRKIYRIVVQGVETLVFALEVKDLDAVSNKDNIYGTNNTKLQNLKLPDCKDGKPLSVATIAFDLSMKTFSGQARMDLIRKVSLFANEPLEQLSMATGRGHETALHLSEIAVLTAGPGNVHEPKEQGIAVSWPIGCGIGMKGTRVASMFKSTSETNSFKHVFGAPVSGWHLVIGFPKKQKKRIRRQVAMNGAATATPVATMSVPVSQADRSTVVISPTAISVTKMTSSVPSLIKKSVALKAKSVVHTESQSPSVEIFPLPSIKPTVLHTTDIAVKETSKSTASLDVTTVPAISKTLAKTTADMIPLVMTPTTPLAASPTETSIPFLAQPTSMIHASKEITITSVGSFTSSLVTLPSTVAANMTTAVKKLKTTEASISLPPTTPRQPVISDTKPTTATSKPHTKKPVTVFNFPPVLNIQKKISRIVLSVGQNLRYRIPEDLFYDKEDGNARNLRLQLQTRKGEALSTDSWIKLREDQREIYGLPLDFDFKLYSYRLVATDSGNKSSFDDFEVMVRQVSEVNPLQLSIKILLDYDSFMKNTSLHMLLLGKIADYFGVNVTNVRVLGFSRGSVIVAFGFDFLQKEPCDHTAISEVIVMFEASSGDLSEKLRRFFLPEFPIESGTLSLTESCSDVIAASRTKGSPKEEDRVWWIYAIIPAVALLALIVIACVVVIRHRRKKKGEKDFMKEKSAYLHLFQKTPTVMEDEYELKENNPLM